MSARTQGPRHLAVTTRFSLARSLVAATASIAIGTTVALAVSGSTFALWKDAAPVSVTSVSSASLTITATETFDDSLWTNLIVGEQRRQSFVVANTGNVPVDLSGAATAGPGIEVRLARTTCTAALAGTPATQQSTGLASLAPGASTTVCLEVAVVAGAQPGASVPIAVMMTGSQQAP